MLPRTILGITCFEWQGYFNVKYYNKISKCFVYISLYISIIIEIEDKMLPSQRNQKSKNTSWIMRGGEVFEAEILIFQA